MTPLQEYQNLLTEFRGLNKAGLTDAEKARKAEIQKRMGELKAQISEENETRSTLAEHEEFLNGSGGNSIEHSTETRAGKPTEDTEMKTAIAQVRRSGLKHFKGADAPKIAFRYGKFLQASIGQSAEARKWCGNNGIEVRRQRESVNELGGYLVPTEFDNEMLDLREEHGIIRSLARQKVMNTDTRQIRRRNGGLKAYAVGEGQKIGKGELSWGNTELKSRKFGVIGLFTEELNADSIISMADEFAGEMAYAFAEKEDECGFIADGTAQYHGMIGVIPGLKRLSGTVANIAGLHKVKDGSTWDSIQADDMTALMGKLPTRVYKRKPRWFCTTQFYFSVFERLLDQANGNSRVELIDGKPRFLYKGFVVEPVQVMSAVDNGAGDIPLLFGDPDLACFFGDRKGITLAMTSEGVVDGESLFENDEHAIRATERFDISWHDLGNASADASKRVAGAIGGLIL